MGRNNATRFCSENERRMAVIVKNKVSRSAAIWWREGGKTWYWVFF